MRGNDYRMTYERGPGKSHGVLLRVERKPELHRPVLHSFWEVPDKPRQTVVASRYNTLNGIYDNRAAPRSRVF